ncbi:lipopolysaccharide biosynthesis protein [Streptococcus sp. A22]|uniref:lipopolysaccharide biosynthesis protein n=1 Tax=Streptococcus sp. A22 TaxID=3373126 RepID=UPI00374D7701
MNKSFKKNIIAAFSAQGVSLILSILMSLFVPKILGIVEFGYWQLFIFYVGYAGFFHLGYIDGLYLKLGGKEYQDLDFDSLGLQFRIFIFIEILVSLILFGILTFFSTDINRFTIFIVFIVYMIISNSSSFIGYIFQAVNLTSLFSISIIIDRICVLVFIILLILLNIESFVPYIFLYTVSKLFSLVYCFLKAKELILSRSNKLFQILLEMKDVLFIGIKLMLANIASMLILGVGRMFIDSHWGIEAFGKVSLALSLTNFFLLFIQQISMVLFPTLRRVGSEKYTSIYINLRDILGLLLPLIFVFYSPIYFLLSEWLPEYSESLKYMILLLPICTFDGKMQMLFNTYYKVVRKEVALLSVNLISLFLSIFLVVVSITIFDSFLLVILSMLFSIMTRSIISDLYFANLFNLKVYKQLFSELLIVFAFIVLTWNFPLSISFIGTSFIYLIFLFLNRDIIKQKFQKK